MSKRKAGRAKVMERVYRVIKRKQKAKEAKRGGK